LKRSSPICLRFHEVEREVRTASAAQVRAPLRADTSIARHYGRRLDALRAALAASGVLDTRTSENET